MGRQTKLVRDKEGVDRREAGYYSTPNFVAEFLARKLLSYKPEAKSVLDPCVGKGELTTPFAREGLNVVGIDIIDRNPEQCSEFIVADFLQLAMSVKTEGLFAVPRIPRTDLIVANPPYNCHETDYIRLNRPQLIESFGKSSALNMYSLFIRAIVENADAGCLIGLVVHDSFLTAIGHRELRNYLFAECVVKNLHLCPTSLFLDQNADVRTCLLILEKRHRQTDPIVHVSNRVRTVAEFRDILEQENFDSAKLSEITLSHELDNREIVVGLSPALSSLFSGQRLGQIAPCVTGVSTGNDAVYISPVKRHGFSIPFYKNPASRRFYAPPDGFIIDDFDGEAKLVSNFMVRNRDLLMQGGLSCSSMGVAFGATVRPPDTLCGVNPNVVVTEAEKWWLLAYLNSRLCLYLLRGVLNRSNMVTAGYASRIPVPNFDEQTKAILAELALKAYEKVLSGDKADPEKAIIDNTIESYLAFDDATVNSLQAFSLDPARLA